ncbi:MAG: DUF839 domain-containing protein [Phycisphaerales bacterium]|jgi:secreted PhoX family phosphatase|nr:DUF839 domain-containing protein [Phycisphaerales bacterium]
MPASPLSRRHFMLQASALAAGASGLRSMMGRHAWAAPAGATMPERYGPLIADPAGIFDLPAGFHYTILSKVGDEMDDGLLVPGKCDGMGAFPGPDGSTILVRNHELIPDWTTLGAFGRDFERLRHIDPARLYDPGQPGAHARLGGTSTLVYDTRTKTLRKQFMSLAGTSYNCAGGITPWGSWLTCEETVDRAGEGGNAKDHGYVFEVPATTEIGLVEPRPIRPMGRFMHEAACVDPNTSIVYMTEDRPDSCIYRYVPFGKEDLHKIGRFQVLTIQGSPSLDTRNWDNPTGVTVGQKFLAEWIDLKLTDPGDDSIRARAFEAGAARFARGEGMYWGNDSAYFACTTGGHAQKGQVWRYTPERGKTTGHPYGTLELFIESASGSVIDNCDNLCVAPWGDVILCEDGEGEQFLVGVTPRGECYKLGRNAMSSGELAGSCFSPDGTTLFVNQQKNGLTLAITGNWRG